MHPQILAWIRYIISWRAVKLNYLERAMFYCTMFLHVDILVMISWLGALGKRIWPPLVKEHSMTTSDDANYYIFVANISNAHGEAKDITVAFTLLSRYTNLDYDLIKKWMNYAYPGYSKMRIDCQQLDHDTKMREIIVDFAKDKWHIVGVTGETDILFDAFPLFTEQM